MNKTKDDLRLKIGKFEIRVHQYSRNSWKRHMKEIGHPVIGTWEPSRRLIKIAPLDEEDFFLVLKHELIHVRITNFFDNISSRIECVFPFLGGKNWDILVVYLEHKISSLWDIEILENIIIQIIGADLLLNNWFWKTEVEEKKCDKDK